MTDLVTAREALTLLGLRDASSITRYVDSGRLIPVRRRPYLFHRRDIEALAGELRNRAAARIAALDAAAEA